MHIRRILERAAKLVDHPPMRELFSTQNMALHLTERDYRRGYIKNNWRS